MKGNHSIYLKFEQSGFKLLENTIELFLRIKKLSR